MPTRRDVVRMSAAFAILPLGRLGAVEQVAGVYRHAVGDMVVTALLDGYLPIEPGLLNGADDETKQRLLRGSFVESGPVDTSINAYVIRGGDRTVLVDGGAGSAFGPNSGKLAQALEAAGVAVEDVDVLVATHLHPDHVGLFATDGAATFPNAELALHEAERAFWSDESNFSGASEQVRNFARMAREAIAPYAERTRALSDGAEIAPGVALVHLPGHTPGHSGLRLSSDDGEALLWGDVVHIGPVQFPRPDVAIAFDVDPEQAVATRRRVMDMAASDRLEIAGSHIVFPSVGHLAAEGDGYRFVPSRWDHAL